MSFCKKKNEQKSGITLTFSFRHDNADGRHKTQGDLLLNKHAHDAMKHKGDALGGILYYFYTFAGQGGSLLQAKWWGKEIKYGIKICLHKIFFPLGQDPKNCTAGSRPPGIYLCQTRPPYHATLQTTLEVDGTSQQYNPKQNYTPGYPLKSLSLEGRRIGLSVMAQKCSVAQGGKSEGLQTC